MVTKFGFALLIFVGSSTLAHAATLYMSPTALELNKADAATISVRLDVDEDECINTIDATINFPPEIVPVDISRGKSILTLWVEEPTINIDEGTITFAGGIPNGYCGRIAGDPRLTNNIVDIIVQSPSFVITSSGERATSTDVQLTFGDETQILLNNNTGSRADAQLYGATITLNDKVGQGDSDWLDVVANDTTPPNSFALKLNRTPNAFGNQYFVTFNTTDKQSGIDHYEVLEESLDELPFFNFEWARVDAPWRTVKSPYVLRDQSLNSVIRVRAIDKAGNEYVTSLTPEEEIREMSQSAKILIGIVLAAVVLFVLLLFMSIWLYSRRRNRAEREEAVEGNEEDEDEYEEEIDDEYEDDSK